MTNELEFELDHLGVGKVTLNGVEVDAMSVSFKAKAGELTTAVIEVPLRKMKCKLPADVQINEVDPGASYYTNTSPYMKHVSDQASQAEPVADQPQKRRGREFL